MYNISSIKEGRWWTSYKKQELLTIHGNFGSPSVFCLLVLFFICVVFSLPYLSVFSVMCPMLPVSQDFPFLKESSVFSNVYFVDMPQRLSSTMPFDTFYTLQTM